MEFKSRSMPIFRDFGTLSSQSAKDWATKFACFSGSGMLRWLEQIGSHLPEADKRRILKEANASLYRRRQDAFNGGIAYSDHSEGSDSWSGYQGVHEDSEEIMCEEIDRRTKGEDLSYGHDSELTAGNRVVVAIDRHAYQGYVGRVVKKRGDGRYEVTIFTERNKMSGYFYSDELIALKTYIRSQHAKLPASYCMAQRNAVDEDVVAYESAG